MPRHGPNPKKANATGISNLSSVHERGGSYGCQKLNGLNSKLEDALFNDSDPTHFLKKELPVHRQMVELSRLGYNYKEIAAVVERTPATVSRTMRQPFARQYVIKQLQVNTMVTMREALEKFGPTGVNNLIEMATDAKLKEQDPKTFAAINESLVTRVLGKPVQPLSHTHNINPDELSDEELAARAMSTPVIREAAAVPGTSGPFETNFNIAQSNGVHKQSSTECDNNSEHSDDVVSANGPSTPADPSCAESMTPPELRPLSDDYS